MLHAVTTMCGIVTIAAGIAVQTAWQRSIRAEPGSPSAKTVLKDASGATVGNATLRDTPNGVLLTVDVTGIPAGIHAFHIHERGRCEAPSFESAGAHLAADGEQHGFLNEAGPHQGDLPSVHVPESRRLSLELIAREVTLRSLFDADGSSLVVHADPDDYHTEPAGGAGKRIACGEIVR